MTSRVIDEPRVGSHDGTALTGSVDFGVLSGGPNSGFMSEDVKKALGGPCAPMACYKDDINLFTLNEVAINWNAPLFWVAAWLDR